MKPARIIWRSASSIGEEITRQLAREFAHSKPRPRNRAMGFSGTDKKPRREFDPFLPTASAKRIVRASGHDATNRK